MTKEAILAEISAELWAMEPRALEAFIARVVSIAPIATHKEHAGDEIHRIRLLNTDTSVWEPLQPSAEVQGFFGMKPPASKMSIANGVATIPISGTLMKKVPFWYAFYGLEATSYQEIADNVRSALENSNVQSIVLRVESPGGQVAGVEIAADAIYDAREKKAISAHIQDIGASGAYWLASQASKISANPNAMVGSIGVYAAYVDSSKMAQDLGIKVHVIQSGEHKGMGVPGAQITDGQLQAMQEVIDGMGKQFAGAVARGRDRSREDVKVWTSGRVWLAGQAKDLGLIDGIGTFEAASSGVRSAASSSLVEGETAMADPKDTKPAAEEAAKIGAEAQKTAIAAERQRLADLKAAFPDDEKFAFQQFEAGATVDQAKVAYCDVLRERASALRTENETLKKAQTPAPKPGARGAAPLPAGDSPEASGAGDFMALAREYAKDKKVSMTKAMSYIARTQPKAFQAHQERCIAEGPEYTARKKQFGVS